jgi:hypothetical protein
MEPLNSNNFSNFFVSSILYTNIASLLAKYSDLVAYVNDLKPTFLSLTETWLSDVVPDSLVSLDGYTIYRNDRNHKKGGGVCIYVSNELLSDNEVIPIVTNTPGIESLFLQVHNQSWNFILGCVYRPPSSNINDDCTLLDVLGELTTRHDKVFVFGDFNMPDISWSRNSGHCRSPSSQLMVDFLTNNHMRQLITQPTRFRANQQPSVLDLILTTEDSSLTNVQYLDPVGKSDHVSLKVDLQICFVPAQRTITFNKIVTNYEKVYIRLEKINWPTTLCDANVENNWSTLKNLLLNTVNECSSVIKVKRSSSKPWINAKILKMVKRKRALWKTFKRTGEQIDYVAHRAFSNKLSTIIKEERIRYELKIANSNNPKSFYKHVRTALGGPVKIPQVRNVDGNIVRDHTDCANIFAESFSKVFTRESVAGTPKLDFPRNTAAFTDIEFSEELVLEKLRGLDKTKSPGPDRITASVLKTCADVLCRPLSMLFGQSFDSGVLPSDWRTAIVCPIFKKGDKFDPGNYRPVSLTSLVVKIMESIIYDTTIKFLVKHHVIPDNQHGFMPGKSITSNLLCCLSDWTKLLDLGRSLDVVYFDFAKAFDRVPRKLLLFKLQHIGIRGSLFYWLDAFLSDRTFKVKVGGVLSASEKVISGVPQGSVLGPLLFIVYTADVKYNVRSSWVMYADDMKIYNDSLNYQMLSNDISNISKWASDWQLPLNIGKCTVLHIGDKNPCHGYYLGGVELLKSSSCLDLGVLVTSNLSWSEHTSYVVKRANKIVYLLSKTFTKTTLAVTAKLIKSYVRPVLEFGHGVWAPNLKRDIDLLESVQRRATRIPFGRNRPEYSERISIMNLPLLSDRRKRGDVILVHQALTGDKNSSIKHLFPLNDGGRTRGHDLKLAKDNFRTSARQNFITNRVFDVWNSLPVEVVTSKTPLGFKSRYDSYVTSVIK